MRRVQLCAHRKAQTPGQRSTRRRTAAKMRVLGLARLLRAVCRRWLGGLIVVDDVQLSFFTGELELVDCELDGPKLTKLLARVGLRCRVVNARAAKVSVSLPITWRRGARIRVVVADPGASLELDDAEHEAEPQKPRRGRKQKLAMGFGKRGGTRGKTPELGGSCGCRGTGDRSEGCPAREAGVACLLVSYAASLDSKHHKRAAF